MNVMYRICWSVFGGVLAGIAWLFAGLIMSIVVAGNPIAKNCFAIAKFAISGERHVLARRQNLTKEHLGQSTSPKVLSLVWFLTCGWWLVVGHYIVGIILMFTVLGRPLARKHFDFARAAISPIDTIIVHPDIAGLIGNGNTSLNRWIEIQERGDGHDNFI